MNKTARWLKRPVASLCICAILVIASLFVLITAENKVSGESSGAYTVTIRHYGVNMQEIEKTISIPLEDGLSSLDGVKDVLSLSEDSRSQVFVRFEQNEKRIFKQKRKNGNYQALRDIVQRVYETLPPSVQRPEIIAADSFIHPVWTAAIPAKDNFSIYNLLNKVIKPSLSALDGVADVELSGIGVNEIIIALKPQEAAFAGINTAKISQTLSLNDVLLPGGRLTDNDREYMLMIDGRYETTESLQDALIPLDTGAYVKLKDIADVKEQEREADILARLNGEKAVIISVLPEFNADKGKLSKTIKRAIEKFTNHHIEFIIIHDRGAEESAAFRSLMSAIVQALCVLAGVSFFLTGKQGRRRYRLPFMCAMLVPLTALVSAAILSALGGNFDKISLSGLAIGLGSAIDSILLCAESFSSLDSVNEGQSALHRLCPVLASASLTTIISLTPLVFLPFVSKTIISIALSIAVVTFVSVLFSLFLAPPLFLWQKREGNIKHIKESYIGDKKQRALIFQKTDEKIKRLFKKIRCLCVKILLFCMKKPALVCVFMVFISGAGLVAIMSAKPDTGEPGSEDSLYLRIEFPAALRKEEVDKQVSAWVKKIKTHSGIKHIQSGSTTGSASVLISFNPLVVESQDIREMVRNEEIPGAFIYINEYFSDERIWEIKIFGDSTEKCVKIAQEAANICRSIPFIKQTVFNFKDGSPNLFIKPQREKIAVSHGGQDISFMNIAEELRGALFGPVIYKRLDKQNRETGELDVRIKGSGDIMLSKNEMGNLLISDRYGSRIKLDTLVEHELQTNLSSVRRENRRRVVSISVRTKPDDPRKIRDLIMPYLDRIELPPAYSFEFDRDALEGAEALSKTIYYFILAMFFCYIIIAISNESFFLPLAVLAVIPPSAAVPALFLYAFGFSFNAASACAFIVVCGMTVNAAVLISDEIKNRLKVEDANISSKARCRLMYKAVRKRLPALFGTSVTTIISSLPFLFLGEGVNIIIRTLSLIVILGSAFSCIFSILFIPALAVLSPRLFKSN
ncbi:MAG: efflux RND transporter permease subunit [Spirochaetaceae bacterium]|jgi:multidrug efflux pump subunit AcrB|nr:efflux RND transporter permease subunit [Spirochaetaceae bacterium]